ncbi:MAG: hypothetical protein DSZ12_00235 [Sulfurovum sp.]|nr:MAG: hypothetical protein DSZ12_00235 [Sulfurovum sp.]
MFVLSAGMSLVLAHKEKIHFAKVKKRVLILGGASLLVSLGSYTQFPNTWIYFGILHFFLFASLVGLLFLKIPKIAFMMGVVIIAGYNFHFMSMHWLFILLQEPLHLPLHYTEDLANIVPWFGVFLIGVSAAKLKIHEKIFNNSFFNATHRVNKSFSFLGKHSLLIYLLHQPILFAFFILMHKTMDMCSK